MFFKVKISWTVFDCRCFFRLDHADRFEYLVTDMHMCVEELEIQIKIFVFVLLTVEMNCTPIASGQCSVFWRLGASINYLDNARAFFLNATDNILSTKLSFTVVCSSTSFDK